MSDYLLFRKKQPYSYFIAENNKMLSENVICKVRNWKVLSEHVSSVLIGLHTCTQIFIYQKYYIVFVKIDSK